MSKRILILLAAFIVGTALVQAQGLSVSSFRELPNDLTANQHGTSKTDQNGETCALIKVVAPEQGFLFDAGSLGIEAVEQHGGEVWVYVPRRSQKISITHKVLGTLRDYTYPIPIEGAHTYEMLLDVGTGIYVTLSPSIARSRVYVDHEFVGDGVIYHRYLNFGQHSLRAVNGMFEGEKTVVIRPGDKSSVIEILMADQSSHFGDVIATVPGQAEIWFDGRRVGIGTWTEKLREGSYTVITKAVDSDDSHTTITVKPGQRNEISLKAPVPFSGYLRVYTRPQNAVVTDSRGRVVDLAAQVELPIGTHQFRFERKGYVSEDREWMIRHGELINDTVQMKRISYIKDNSFYFGIGYTVIGLQGGITPVVGAILKNHDVQLSYTFGTTKSSEAYLYDGTKAYTGALQFSENTFSFKYGYQIPLMGRIVITPQVGLAVHSLVCSTKDSDYSTKYANGAKANSLTVGAKVALAPIQHLNIFAAPQMGFVLKQDDGFKTVTDVTGTNASGFGINIGVLANF